MGGLRFFGGWPKIFFWWPKIFFRGIVNRVMDELGYMSVLAPDFPYASLEMSQLRNSAEKQGMDGFSPLWCGQNAQGCQEISAKELTLQLAGKC